MVQIRIPTISEIEVARSRLGTLIVETPVWHGVSEDLKRQLGRETEPFFKLELLQQTGSFKPRGALTVMMGLSTEVLSRGVTAISAGNHAIAVGYAAKVVGASAKVVMPKTANPERVQRCKAFGAEVLLADDVHSAFDLVKRIEREEERYFVHPFEGFNTTLGTATLGLELYRQVPRLEAVIVPIGGGGLCSGLAAAVKQCNPDCQVIGVEPVGADTMSQSFASGKPESVEKVATIADSLAPPYALPYSFEVCRRFVDDMVLVDDDAMCRAMALLFRELKLAVEPAGAAATAALAGPLKDRLRGKRVGLLVCGANIDAESFHRCLMRGLANISETSPV